MTEAKETEIKKPLTLSRPGKLELKKTVQTGQVRQSFSHGRSKTVTVEVKKKRTYAPSASGKMAEVKAEKLEEAEGVAETALAPVVKTRAPAVGTTEQPRALTETERAARVRALQGVVHTDESAADEAGEAELLQEAAADAELRGKNEGDRVQAKDDARRAADDEARRLAEEEVHGPAGPMKLKSGAAAKVAAKVVPSAPAAPESERADRGKRARPDKPRPVSERRGEQRRRAGKLTITQALEDDGEERVRSLASVRRARERERQRQLDLAPTEGKAFVREVVVPETITVQELANRMAERGADVIKVLMKMDVKASMSHVLDADTAELVVGEFGQKAKRVAESDVEIGLDGEPDDPEKLQPRAPVVTVMGHVDHGKTSLLDALRETDVVSREAGGITQHIGAYQVETPAGGQITFLDTPGHEAFTEMRARGAKITDIVVLVVAADDSIQPQTVEAINHAKAAKVPVIVAINKIDRPNANPDKVRQDLLQHEFVVEELGGDVLAIDISATEKINLDKIEEAILLQAEILELSANPDRPGQGVIVEAKLERGRGPVATVLISRGTLRVGDICIAGGEWGKVRALIDDKGQAMESAGPSVPVEILGLNGAPAAGDDFAVVETEARAREITEYRRRQVKREAGQASERGTVEEMFSKIAAGEADRMPIVIKADVRGSVEAIVGSLEGLATDEVACQVLHSGVGGITESDVALARASQALIIGFNVRANPQARELAQRDKVEIRYYAIIYEIIDDLKAILSGMLTPTVKETLIGNAEIREVFSITKVGKVAGCMVTNGAVRRGSKVRLLRDNVVVHEGKLSSLKRFKDEVREVKESYECGMAFENYQDIKSGDVVECFEVEEVARHL
jgi:translation initiation factor IF-2